MNRIAKNECYCREASLIVEKACSLFTEHKAFAGFTAQLKFQWRSSRTKKIFKAKTELRLPYHNKAWTESNNTAQHLFTAVKGQNKLLIQTWLMISNGDLRSGAASDWTCVPERFETLGNKCSGVYWKSKVQNKGMCIYTWSRRLFCIDLARQSA